MAEQERTAPPTGSGWGRVAGIVSLVAVVLSLLVTTFAWPGARGEAAGMSIAVTGDTELVEEFMANAGQGLGEVVDLEEVDSREVAEDGIKERGFIGALVLVDGAPEVLTASANGQVPAAFMTEMSAQLQTMLDTQIYAGMRGGVEGAAASGTDPSVVVGQMPESLPQVTVTDVVPYSDGDPNGVGATTAGIPLTVGALLAGLVIAYTITGAWRKIGAVLGLGIGGGLLLTLILSTWLQVYPGSFGTVWLALGLSLTATSGLFAGLYSAFGRVGLGVAAGLTLFAAMPWAAFAVPYEFLPAGLGHIGQWLIPGATITLTRVVAYFPEASAAMQWWVLAGWSLLGIVLTLVVRRDRTPAPSAHEGERA